MSLALLTPDPVCAKTRQFYAGLRSPSKLFAALPVGLRGKVNQNSLTNMRLCALLPDRARTGAGSARKSP